MLDMLSREKTGRYGMSADDSGADGTKPKQAFRPLQSLRQLFGRRLRVPSDGGVSSAGSASGSDVVGIRARSTDNVVDEDGSQEETDNIDRNSSKMPPKQLSMSTDCVFTTHFGSCENSLNTSTAEMQGSSSLENVVEVTEFTSRSSSTRRDNNAVERAQTPSDPEDFFSQRDRTVKSTTSPVPPAAESPVPEHKPELIDVVDLGVISGNTAGRLTNEAALHRRAVKPRGQRPLTQYQQYVAGRSPPPPVVVVHNAGDQRNVGAGRLTNGIESTAENDAAASRVSPGAVVDATSTKNSQSPTDARSALSTGLNEALRRQQARKKDADSSPLPAKKHPPAVRKKSPAAMRSTQHSAKTADDSETSEFAEAFGKFHGRLPPNIDSSAGKERTPAGRDVQAVSKKDDATESAVDRGSSGKTTDSDGDDASKNKDVEQSKKKKVPTATLR